jgi:transcriptional regulator with XRE-family HTH domain
MLKEAKTKEDKANQKRLTDLRARLGLSFKEFGDAVGKGERMIRYYESGEQFVPQHVARLVEYMEKEKEAAI